MLRLAVANRTETFERIQDPLAERDIAVGHLPYHERAIRLDAAPHGPGDFDVGLVFPGREMEGGVVDALVDVPWVNGRRAIMTSRNKAEVLVRLRRAGLPTPRTSYVSNPADPEELLTAASALSFPLVVKPNSTTRGIGVTKVHDVDSLLGVADYLGLVHDYRATGDKSYLLQEYIPDATDYRVMVVDGEYVGAVERRLPSDEPGNRWKHNVHRGAVAEGVTVPAEYQRLAEEAAVALGIPFLGVDLLVGQDRAVINETNARPTVDDATKYETGFYDRLATLVRETAEAAE
ncbi:MAG: RimK family alpha-L-glutamate ligase [Halobacteriaceae archaeon]